MGEKLSVIVQASGASLELSLCLTALTQQKLTDDDLEIIVIDPRGARSIHQLVRWWNLTLTRAGSKIRLMHLLMRHLSVDLDRTALRASSGSLVVFIDEDQRPGPDWVRESIAELHLREQCAPNVDTPSLVTGLVQRREHLISSLGIEQRAVSTAVAAVGELAPSSDSSTTPHRKLFPEQLATVTPLASAPRLRVTPLDDYVIVAALVATISAILLHEYAIALASLSIWFSILILAAKRRSLRSAWFRPFDTVFRLRRSGAKRE